MKSTRINYLEVNDVKNPTSNSNCTNYARWQGHFTCTALGLHAVSYSDEICRKGWCAKAFAEIFCLGVFSKTSFLLSHVKKKNHPPPPPTTTMSYCF
jgi:hypothetical protein